MINNTIKGFGLEAVENEEGVLFQVVMEEEGFNEDISKPTRGRADYNKKWKRDRDGMFCETYLYGDGFQGGSKSWVRIKDRFGRVLGNYNPKSWNDTEDFVLGVVRG